MKGQRVAAFGCPHPRRSLSGEGDLLAAEARLVADHGAGAALALQAVAHGDARWFTLNRKVKLPAAAGGASGHGLAPWLSIGRSVAGLQNDAPSDRNGARLPLACIGFIGAAQEDCRVVCTGGYHSARR
jgi:hypothetical protein